MNSSTTKPVTEEPAKKQDPPKKEIKKTDEPNNGDTLGAELDGDEDVMNALAFIDADGANDSDESDASSDKKSKPAILKKSKKSKKSMKPRKTKKPKEPKNKPKKDNSGVKKPTRQRKKRQTKKVAVPNAVSDEFVRKVMDMETAEHHIDNIGAVETFELKKYKDQKPNNEKNYDTKIKTVMNRAYNLYKDAKIMVLSVNDVLKTIHMSCNDKNIFSSALDGLSQNYKFVRPVDNVEKVTIGENTDFLRNTRIFFESAVAAIANGNQPKNPPIFNTVSAYDPLPYRFENGFDPKLFDCTKLF